MPNNSATGTIMYDDMPYAGGGEGPAILDGTGTIMPKREKIKITNSIITDDSANNMLEIEPNVPARSSSYDNTESHLDATNVQDAIDEISTKSGVECQRVTLEYYLAHKQELDSKDIIVIIEDSGVANNADNVLYDNTVSELTSVNVQGAIDEIEGQISQLNSNLSHVIAHNSGTTVDITGLSSYTAQNDGYIKIVNNNSTTGYINVFINGVQLVSLYAGSDLGAYAVRAIFCKKGVVITHTSNMTNYALRFEPYV